MSENIHEEIFLREYFLKTYPHIKIFMHKYFYLRRILFLSAHE